MKRNVIKSLIITCCVFVFGISGAFIIKKIDETYAVSYACCAKFYHEGGTWVNKKSTSDYQTIPYSGKLLLSDSRIAIVHPKTECTFGGWAMDSPNGKIVTKDALDASDSANGCAVLYAVWNCEYTVSFDLTGGSGSIPSQTIGDGGKVKKPSDPTRGEKYTFQHWSTSEGGSAYEFNTPVTKNLTLYAVWKENELQSDPEQKPETEQKPEQKPEPQPEPVNYTVTFNMQGLPFINYYSKTFEQNSNLNEYKQEYNLIVFDATTYYMSDESNCANVLKDIRGDLSTEELTERCSNISKMFDCQNNEKCYGSKYIYLDEVDNEEIIYLNSNDIINVEYEKYGYAGLYKEQTCETEYNYGDLITDNIELYECFEFIEASSEEPEFIPPVVEPEKKPTPSKPKKEKEGISPIVIVLIIGAIFLVVTGIFLVLKAKRANNVK